MARRQWLRVRDFHDLEDLVQVAHLELYRARELFDPERGVKFGTYAIQRMKFGVLDYLREQDRLPRSVRKKIRTTERKQHHSLPLSAADYQPRPEDLKLYSLDSWMPGTQAGRLTLLDELVDPASLDPPAVLQEAVREEVRCAVAKLPPREAHVVRLYFWGALTLREISERMRISESRTYQLYCQAKKRLSVRLAGRV